MIRRLWHRFSDWVWFKLESWLDVDDDDASGAGVDWRDDRK